MSSKHVFIDTNIFLHYQSFDEIEWLTFLNVGHVIIHVSSVVVQELDKHKYNSSKKLRDKAGKVIKKLHKFASTGLEVDLKPNISMRFEVGNETLDFTALRLDPNSQDDRLLANILSLRETSPSSSLVLVTADLGLLLKAKHYQVEAITLPDELRLPSELDETEKRIKELEKEVLELQRRIPNLQLCFGDGSDRFNYKRKASLPSGFDVDEAIEKRIGNLKEEFPKMQEIQTDSQKIDFSNINISQMDGSDKSEILPSEISSYNKKLEEFYENYRQYVGKLMHWLEIRRRTFLLEISISNSGTCPAEDIEIFMHFPDGFTLCRISNMPDKPEEPKSPSRPTPRTRKERLSQRMTIPSLVSPRIALPSNLQNKMQANISSPDIRRSNSYDVDIHVHKLKQSKLEPFSPMLIVFDSLDQVSSFRIDYRVIAANLPKAVTGALHVTFSSEADS
jgi:hypothetical protein